MSLSQTSCFTLMASLSRRNCFGRTRRGTSMKASSVHRKIQPCWNISGAACFKHGCFLSHQRAKDASNWNMHRFSKSTRNSQSIPTRCGQRNSHRIRSEVSPSLWKLRARILSKPSTRLRTTSPFTESTRGTQVSVMKAQMSQHTATSSVTIQYQTKMSA